MIDLGGRFRPTMRYSDDLPSPGRLQLLRHGEVLDGELAVAQAADAWEAEDL